MTRPGRAALLLMAFGGPATLDEVGPFMTRLMRREPPPASVESAKERYRLVGGRSPLPAMVQDLADAVGEALAGDVDVSFGMRYSEPFIADAVAELVRSGHRTFVAISLSPQYSEVSSGAYEKALLEAADAARAGEFLLVQSWHTRDGFLDALADRLAEARKALGPARADWRVVFTAHSLPETDGGVERYRREVSETVEAVADRAGIADWSLAFQSRGRSPGRWLGPDLEEVLGERARAGASGVVVAPAGFVTEHMETLYDLDVEAREVAERLGMGFARVPAVGTHQAFVGALAGMAREYVAELDRRAGT